MEENELRIGQVEVEAMEAKLEVESLRQEREESENAWRIERRTLAKEVKGLRAIVAELELKLGDLKEEREAEKVQSFFFLFLLIHCLAFHSTLLATRFNWHRKKRS